jgi:hypothetical protein
MPSAITLFVGVVSGAVGVAYFVYGKRQQRIAFLAAGVGLCVYPYLVDGPFLLILTGLVLLAGPFLVDR